MAQWSERGHRIISREPESFPRGAQPSLLSLQPYAASYDTSGQDRTEEGCKHGSETNKKTTDSLKHPYPHILIKHLCEVYSCWSMQPNSCDVYRISRKGYIRTLCIQLRVYSHPIRTLKGVRRWFNQQPFCWLFLRTGIIDWWCHRDKQKCQINGDERHAVRRRLTFLSIKYSVPREKLWCKLWMSLSFSLQKFPKGHARWQRLIYNQQQLVNKQLKECLE